MKKIAIILYGPPGSGKGTQANLLAFKLGLIHFDTGRFLESVVHDPSRQKEKFVQHERKLFDAGKLMTPSFVFREVEREARGIASAGWGLVFSGSPRTLPEAEGLIPILSELYGKKNIFTFVLKIPETLSLQRNSKRLVCRFCGAPLLTAYYPSKKPKHCPLCSGPLYRRTLDNARTIITRLKEYREKTEPIFSMLKKKKYKVLELNGQPAPYAVFKKMYAFISRGLGA